MIYPSLSGIVEQLNHFMYDKWGTTTNGTNVIVQLDNIANINDEKNDLQDKVIVTLIRTEEEPTLKNGPFYSTPNGSSTIKHHPAIYLNLYLLFSITKKNYKESLQLLSDTIMFFQSHKVFGVTVSNDSNQEENFKIHMDLHDIALQEIFELWSNLGNKQFPFILYKARVLRMIDKDQFETANLIKSTKVVSRKEA
tara:strand:- start:40377 stop:40964 length:588 start_codon:yes stop_codon:yes gene_type:complete